MKIIYEDTLYPGSTKKYQGKTIGEILEDHPNPISFITQFNKSNKYCLSDEIAVNRKKGSFIHPRLNWSVSHINDFA